LQVSIAQSELPDRLAKRRTASNMHRSIAVLFSAPAILATAAFLVGKGLLRRTARPIVAEPTDLRQIDQAVVVLKAEDEAAALTAAKQVLEFQQANPDLFYYTRTRIYLAPYANADGTIDANKRRMTFFDEFDNYLVYFAALVTAVPRRPAVLRLARGMLKYAQTSDGKDHRGHITWTERQGMRVNVESRKPLYPADGGSKTPTADVVMADQHVAAIKTTDRAEVIAAIGARLAYERQHPDRFYFTRARVFTAAYPRDRAKEKLMVFYESDDRDKYRESFSKAEATDAGYGTLMAEVSRYVLDDPETRVTTWTELQELRVQYESREPLYPYPDKGTEHPSLQSPQQPGGNAGAQWPGATADRAPSASRVMTNLMVKAPVALVKQATMAVENVVAALQTQDPRVFAESMKLGLRRTAGALRQATPDQPHSAD
jgi:hypothetical protein